MGSFQDEELGTFNDSFCKMTDPSLFSTKLLFVAVASFLAHMILLHNCVQCAFVWSLQFKVLARSGVGSSGFTALACKFSQQIVQVPTVLELSAFIVYISLEVLSHLCW